MVESPIALRRRIEGWIGCFEMLSIMYCTLRSVRQNPVAKKDGEVQKRASGQETAASPKIRAAAGR